MAERTNRKAEGSPGIREHKREDSCGNESGRKTWGEKQVSKAKKLQQRKTWLMKSTREQMLGGNAEPRKKRREKLGDESVHPC